MSIAGLAAHLRSRFGWGGPPPPGHRRALILLSGLPGTGKSFLAGAIAQRRPVVVLRSDEVRKAIYRRPAYTTKESGVVYLACYTLLDLLLADGYTVIFDATNLAREARSRARAIAEQTGARTLTLISISPPEVVAERLRQRATGEAEPFSSDAGWDVHQRLADSVEPARNEPGTIVVDTSQSIAPALAAVDQFLRETGQAGEDNG